MYEIRFQIKSMFIYDSFHLFPSTHRNHLQRQPSSSSSPITFHSVRPFLSCVFFPLLKMNSLPSREILAGSSSSRRGGWKFKTALLVYKFHPASIAFGCLIPSPALLVAKCRPTGLRFVWHFIGPMKLLSFFFSATSPLWYTIWLLKIGTVRIVLAAECCLIIPSRYQFAGEEICVRNWCPRPIFGGTWCRKSATSHCLAIEFQYGIINSSRSTLCFPVINISIWILRIWKK